MTKAIILAAGKGSRLKGYFNIPKCLIRLGKNKESILERTYKNLINSKIYNINVITGYKSYEIKKNFKGKVNYIHFKDYKKSNNLQTLLSVKHLLNSELICLFADIIYEKKFIKKLSDNKKKICLLIDTSNVLEGTMRVKIKKGNIQDIGSHIPVSEGDGNFIGIAKFSNYGSNLLKRYLVKQKNNYKDYYTLALRKMNDDGIKINYIDVSSSYWKEIDTNKDYIEAKKIIRQIEGK